MKEQCRGSALLSWEQPVSTPACRRCSRLGVSRSCVEALVCTVQTKSWRFHSSRFKSLIRRWTILVCSLSVAPKAIWNMYPVAAMWVTEGWTQHQTLEYLCSYDHGKAKLSLRSPCCSQDGLSTVKTLVITLLSMSLAFKTGQGAFNPNQLF